MIEKVISGELLDDGKRYNGNYETGFYCHIKNKEDGKTYVACFPCDNADDEIPFNKGQYLVLRGILRYSNSKYDELDVQEISIPFTEFFDAVAN